MNSQPFIKLEPNNERYRSKKLISREPQFRELNRIFLFLTNFRLVAQVRQASNSMQPLIIRFSKYPHWSVWLIDWLCLLYVAGGERTAQEEGGCGKSVELATDVQILLLYIIAS